MYFSNEYLDEYHTSGSSSKSFTIYIPLKTEFESEYIKLK